MAISKEEIKKLADLARIEIGEEEAESLRGEMDAILDYVGQVKEVVGTQEEGLVAPLSIRGVETKSGGDMNTMREDEALHQPGEFSQELINEFPRKEGDYLKVKKIL